MKKIGSLLLSVLLCVVMAGCSGASQPAVNQSTEQNTATPSLVPTPAPQKIEMTEIDFDHITLAVPKDAILNSDGYVEDKNAMYRLFDENGDPKFILTAQTVLDNLANAEEFNSQIDDFKKGLLKNSPAGAIEEKEIDLGGETGYYITFSQVINDKDFLMNSLSFYFRGKVYAILCGYYQEDAEVYKDCSESIFSSVTLIEPRNDILKDDSRRDEIMNNARAFKFEDIINIVDDYLASGEVDDTDNAYEIQDAAQIALGLLPNCNIVTDDFSGESVLYGSVKEITANTNFVPYIDGSWSYTEISTKVGFRRSGWLFFEYTDIKVGDNEFISDSYSHSSVERDVIKGGGGTVEEIAETVLDAEDIEKILHAKEPILRFTGKDDKTYDHKLSQGEIESLDNVNKMAECIERIRKVVREWEDSNK